MKVSNNHEVVKKMYTDLRNLIVKVMYINQNLNFVMYDVNGHA